MAFPLAFVTLIVEPSGGLIYHLVTLFAIQLVLAVAFEYWNRHRRDSTAVRLLVTSVDLVFARVLLILIAVLGRLGVLSLSTVMPPLERFLDLFTLLLVIGTFLLPAMERHSRLGVALLFLMLLITTGVYVVFAPLWPQAEAQTVPYSSYWQGVVWEVLTVAILLLALVASLLWRRGDWGLLTCMLGLWIVGHVLQMMVPIANSHIAGWVRLANLAALPLLASLAYRLALRAPPVYAADTAGVQTWLQRGVSAVRAGDRTLARRCFQNAREMDPDNVLALLWLAWLAHTRLESLALFSRVLEIEPDNEDAHAGIRWTRVRVYGPGEQGRWSSAGGRRLSAEAPSVPEFSFLRAALTPASGPESARREASARPSRWASSSKGTKGTRGALLRFVWRLLPVPILLVSLVFFVALAMELGRAGGLGSLPSSVHSAAGFTLEYLGNLTQGDMGAVVSPYPAAPAVSITAELARALPRSLGLLAVALSLAIVAGLSLGVGAGLRRKTRFSGFLVFLSVLGISTPSYFAAMLLIWFGVWLYRATGMDFIPIHGFGWDAHLVLPALVLAARPAANVMRLGYNALVEVAGADFVRTAHAKGLGPWIVFFRHVLRNAGVPLLTTVAVSLRFSLAILPIVEYIFNWSGVGQGLLEAIQAQDTTTVVGMVLPLAVLFVLVNLFLEMLYPLVDPRLRAREGGVV